jgi:selenium metabolism protein YedF
MKQIDARGKACPMPVVLTRRAVADDAAGEGVAVLVNDEMAAQNIEKMAGQCAWSCQREMQGTDILLIVRAGGEAAEAPEKQESRIEKGLCVAVGSDRMGDGDAALGRQLMKAFLFALSQRDQAPETILFYNSGAYLTCEGSLSLADVGALARAGTRVLTCGTCLNFYGLTQRLAVGEVTNMYAIAGAMTDAEKLVKP